MAYQLEKPRRHEVLLALNTHVFLYTENHAYSNVLFIDMMPAEYIYITSA